MKKFPGMTEEEVKAMYRDASTLQQQHIHEMNQEKGTAGVDRGSEHLLDRTRGPSRRDREQDQER